MSAGLVWQCIRQWWDIATPIGLFLAVGVAALVWFTFVPTYEAEAWLKIESTKPVLVFDQKSAAQDLFARTVVELIRSPVVLDLAAEKPEVASLPEVLEAEDPVRMLKEGLVVGNENESELFYIRFESASPEGATTIVNTVLNVFLELQENEVVERNRRIVEVLEREIKRREGEIKQLRKEVESLAGPLMVNEPTFLNDDRAKTRSPSIISEWTQRLSDSIVEREMREAELEVYKIDLERLEADSGASVSEAAIDQQVRRRPEYLLVEQQLDIARRRLDYNVGIVREGVETRAVAKSREAVAQYEAELERISQQLKSEIRPLLGFQAREARRSELERQLAQAKAFVLVHEKLEEQLSAKIQAEQTKQAELGGNVVRLEFRRADLARAEEVYQRILERSEILKTESRAPSRISMVRPAKEPIAPIELYPIRMMVAAAIGCFFLPFAIAFLWEFRVQRVTGSRQVAEGARVPLIAEVPGMPSRSRLAPLRTAGGVRRQRAMFRDSIHYLCRSILLPDSGQQLQALAVTSAVSGEGKTSLSYVLASSIAMYSGERVLLIDGDLRRPDVHEFLESAENVGLSELLANGSGEDAFRRYVQAHDERLEILAAGHPKDHPHALLGRGKFEALLMNLRRHYRYIVIDTPPILTCGESLTLCRAADGVLVCVMRDYSRQSQVQSAYRRLAAAGANPIGAVLSGVSARQYTSDYGYYCDDSEPSQFVGDAPEV